MSEINYQALLLMVLINGGLLLFTYRLIPKNTRRIYYLFSIVSMFIFSGFGISYYEIGQEFLGEYLIFSTVFILSLFLTMRSTKNNKIITYMSDKIITPINNDLNMNSKKGNTFYAFCTILFYLTFLVFLVIPELRISQVWNPPKATVIGGYERINLAQNNIILDLAMMMRTLLLPFFMVYLYRLKLSGKSLKIIIFISIWIYFYFLSQIYIGRYEFIVFLIFLFVLLTSKQINKLYISGKQLITIAGVFIISIPTLLSYQYSRIGAEMQNLTFGHAMSELMGIELQFPSNYSVTIALSESISAIKYFLWFILLPIPSFVLPEKGEITILLNRVFSSSVLGVNYGETGYYGLVPSILGEAFLLYGQHFFWIHAIFLAVMLASICKFLEKMPELSAINLYIAINAIAIARGGTQGFFGLVINSLIFYIVFKWGLITYKKRRFKDSV